MFPLEVFHTRRLERKGAKLIPTVWSDTPELLNWPSLYNTLAANTLVVKRQVGANAEGQYIVKFDEQPPALSYPVMIQPFLTNIADEGELSFIFIDNEFSHALIKKPAANDYRIQVSYGGTEHPIEPAPTDFKAAQAILEMLDETPLYARVDMLRNDAGELCLMELELIEPFLYPLQGPELTDRIYSAVKNRLDR